MSNSTNVVEKISRALSRTHLVGIHAGMQSHTWYTEVLEISEEIKRSGADLVITIGGGSIIDGAKAAVFVGYRTLHTGRQTPDYLLEILLGYCKWRQYVSENGQFIQNKPQTSFTDCQWQ